MDLVFSSEINRKLAKKWLKGKYAGKPPNDVVRGPRVKPFFSYKGNYGSQSKLVEKDDVLQDDDLIVKELNKFFQNDVSTLNIEKPGSSPIGHQTIFLIL